MYNEERKIEFISSQTDSIATAYAYENLFNTIAKYEEEYHMDICEMPYDENFLKIISSLTTLRSKSVENKFVLLKQYSKWCESCGIKIGNGIYNMDSTDAKKLCGIMVANPIHLLKYLDDVFDPASMQTIDCVYRCYYWMAFSGMDESELITVKDSEIDLDKLVIYHNECEFPIYREAISDFYNTSRLHDFVYYHPQYKKPILRHRVDGDILLRGIKADINLPTLKVELSRRQRKAIKSNKTDLKLSYNRVYLSGLFYRMYERERAGIPVDFTDAVSKFASGKEYKMDSGRSTVMSKLNQIERDYVHDYELWKSAFQK